MNRKSLHGFAIISVVCVVVLLLANTHPAIGAGGGPAAAIPEEQQISTTIPWLAGLGLTACTLLVAFKNAKRSHLD